MRVSGFLAGLVVAWGPSEGGLAWPSLVAGLPDARGAGLASDGLGRARSEVFCGVGNACPGFKVGFFCETDDEEEVVAGLDNSGGSPVFVGWVS